MCLAACWHAHTIPVKGLEKTYSFIDFCILNKEKLLKFGVSKYLTGTLGWCSLPLMYFVFFVFFLRLFQCHQSELKWIPLMMPAKSKQRDLVLTAQVTKCITLGSV